MSSKYIITNIKRGTSNYINAELRDKDTNELRISATLDYIVAVLDRYLKKGEK